MSTDFAPKPTVTSGGQPIAGQRLAVAGSVVKLAAFNALTNLVIADVQGNDMYVTFDGRTPSASAGAQLYAGNSYAWNVAAAQSAQFIQQSGAGTVDVQEYVSILGSTQMPDVNVLKPKPYNGGAGLFTSLAVSGNASISGTLTPSQTGGIVGTTTNNNANAGSIGEYISNATTSPGSGISSTISANVTSISLTAGDWDVWGVIIFLPANTTVLKVLQGLTTTTSATVSSNDPSFVSLFLSLGVGADGSNPTTMVPVMKRYSLAATTTVFLVCNGNFTTSTCNVWGSIQARRRR